MPSNIEKKSSYLSNEYGILMERLVHLYQPKNIIEFGILNGYSLEHLQKASQELGIELQAYDIFDECTFTSADQNYIQAKFGDLVQYGNYFNLYNEIEDQSVDMFHIDIGNTGVTYNFFFDNYINKLTDGGVAIIEGGSLERDNYKWMSKFPKIRPVLESRCQYPYFIFEPWPSLTLIHKTKEQ